MNHKYCIDSSAWIEYFSGTQKGLKIKKLIEEDLICCSIIAISELADKFEKEEKEFDTKLKFIQSRSTIIQLNIDIALQAAKIKKDIRKQNPKFGLVDGIHLATSQQENSVFVTSDNDFNGIKNTLII